ncbi:hypothetical protein BOX15_Mlig019304g2, partial [Macrostomum lignano]
AEAAVSYAPGNCPLVLTCPHDGSLRPADMPDRDPQQPGVVTCNDDLVAPLTRRVHQLLTDRYGLEAFLIVNNVDRLKVNMNRSEARACQPGAAASVTAYRAYHGRVRAALEAASRLAAAPTTMREWVGATRCFWTFTDRTIPSSGWSLATASRPPCWTPVTTRPSSAL